jgi:hypothetical protein
VTPSTAYTRSARLSQTPCATEISWPGNPYIVGGTALGSDGSAATLSPFELLYVVFPSWFAPAAVKLVQMVLALGFTFLICRRLGAGQVASLVGGIPY